MMKYKLGDIAKTGSGGTPKSTVAEYYENGNIPWINSGELNNPFISSTSNFITQKGYDNSSAKLFPPQTVLLAMYGATAGKASLLEFEACTNQAICAIMPNQDILLPRFLKYKLDTMYNYLVGLSTGSARDNLSQDGIKALELCIPPLSEQKKIASVLSALDDKIALNKKMNQKLEAMAKRLYDYWFVQFDFPDKNGRPYKTTGGPMTYNPTLKREIPEGWEVKRLGKSVEVLKDGTHNPPARVENGIPLLTGTMFGENFLDYTKATYISKEDYLAIHSKYQPLKNDIIITKIGTLGNVNILRDIDIPIAIHCNSALLRFKKVFGSYYPFFFCKSDLFQLRLKSVKGQSIQEFASLDKIASVLCEIPSEEILKSFNNAVEPIMRQLIRTSKEVTRLTALRDKLLPLLMNGQVEVK